MHITTSKTKRILFAPVLKAAGWLTPRCPEFMAKVRYYSRFHKKLDLKNPKNLNEKILWLAINSDTREWSRLADKYLVREYIHNCGLDDILVPFFGVWDKAEEIDFDKLPQSFIMKSTNGSCSNIIIRDKSLINQEQFVERVKEIEDKKVLITGVGDLHYMRNKSRIIAEGLLENDEVSAKYSETLIDYKIWVLNGRAEYIWVCMNRFVHNKDGAEVLTYDREWMPHPEFSVWSNDFSEAQPMPKPANFEKMLTVAERLCQGFPVVRCDLYNLNGKIYFGEMTFTSLGGMMDFYTPEFLQICGDKIDLSAVSTKGKWNMAALKQTNAKAADNVVAGGGKCLIITHLCDNKSNGCQLAA